VLVSLLLRCLLYQGCVCGSELHVEWLQPSPPGTLRSCCVYSVGMIEANCVGTRQLMSFGAMACKCIHEAVSSRESLRQPLSDLCSAPVWKWIEPQRFEMILYCNRAHGHWSSYLRDLAGKYMLLPASTVQVVHHCTAPAF
jgi:hypothetical protein